jgi:hypothetical protein
MLARVTTGLRTRVFRTVFALGVASLCVAVAVIVVPMTRPAGPPPVFQLPVACGEAWHLSTYPGHGEYDIDLLPVKGQAWGRPVLASSAGTVIAAGINGTLGGRTPDNPNGPRGSGGGYWVKLDHGGKWVTVYLHLLKPPLVEVGQRVRQGQQIGEVGSTGDSGAPHLHYEQRRGWDKVEAHFDGAPSGITDDNREYSVIRTSKNCAVVSATVGG